MKTIYTKDPLEAAEFIRNGGIVAFPTETVYGLGADVFNGSAIAKIFDAKQRPSDNPLIAHVASRDQIRLLTEAITETAEALIKEFFPGPLTVVLRKRTAVPMIATAGLDTVGIRMPGFELAHEFLAACGTPVVAPSANLSGRPSPTTWQAVAEDIDGRLDCVLQANATEIGLESTVVDCTGDIPVVLRSGSVSIEQLRVIVPSTLLIGAEEREEARSPGMKHQHYSPSARVVIVDDATSLSPEPREAYIGITRASSAFDRELISPNLNAYAHSLFEFFRECDRQGIETIYCERVDETGIGAALMDRIRRAAGER